MGSAATYLTAQRCANGAVHAQRCFYYTGRSGGFYDRGGGAGLRFDLLNQTLPADRLNLSAKEKKQIIAFLQALSDTAIHQQKKFW